MKKLVLCSIIILLFSNVFAKKKYMVINSQGVEISPVKYDEVGFFNEGLTTVKLNWKYGAIDRTGKEYPISN